MQRSQTVRLRVTEMEKEAWGAAAGGKGKVSDWLRALANREAHTGTTITVEGGSGGYRVTDVVIDEATKISFPTAEQTVITKPFTKPEDCPRWMHHRKGVYCGTCKKVN